MIALAVTFSLHELCGCSKCVLINFKKTTKLLWTSYRPSKIYVVNPIMSRANQIHFLYFPKLRAHKMIIHCSKIYKILKIATD